MLLREEKNQFSLRVWLLWIILYAEEYGQCKLDLKDYQIFKTYNVGGWEGRDGSCRTQGDETGMAMIKVQCIKSSGINKKYLS